MSNNTIAPELDEETKARHSKVKEDFIRLSSVIPNDLRARLELYLTDPNARQAVLELQLLAIQFGRGLERIENGLADGPSEVPLTLLMREMFRKPVGMPPEHGAQFGAQTGRWIGKEEQPANTPKSPLVDVSTQSKPIDPRAIVVVPGYAFPTGGKRRDN